MRKRVEFKFTAKDLFDALNDFDKRALGDIADLIIKDIKLQAQGSKRRGIGDDGETHKLPELSKGYIKRRRVLGKDGRLSKFTKPGQQSSNITQTGNLMLGLSYEVDVRSGQVDIFFAGDHATANISRDKLYTYLLEKNENYQVLGIRDAILVQITKLYTRQIAKQLRDFR